MGAPGTLIPAEVPSCHFPSFGTTKRSFLALSEASQDSFPLVDDSGLIPMLDRTPEGSEDSIFKASLTSSDDRILIMRDVPQDTENDIGKLANSVPRLAENLSGSCEKPMSAHKRKVKSVSQYVISAAKDPEFAQKLHAVLKESGASPPPDLFLDMNSHSVDDTRMIEKAILPTMANAECAFRHYSNGFLPGHEQSVISTTQDPSDYINLNIQQKQFFDDKRDDSACDSTAKDFKLGGVKSRWTNDEAVKADQVPQIIGRDLQETAVGIFSNVDEEFCQSRPESSNSNDPRMGRTCDDAVLNITSTSYNEANTMLGEVAEWEILWEDLQIGDRIGIGKFLIQ